MSGSTNPHTNHIQAKYVAPIQRGVVEAKQARLGAHMAGGRSAVAPPAMGKQNAWPPRRNVARSA